MQVPNYREGRRGRRNLDSSSPPPAPYTEEAIRAGSTSALLQRGRTKGNRGLTGVGERGSRGDGRNGGLVRR